VLWLFGYVLFTSAHGDSVDARFLSLAREIAEARCSGDVPARSWGSAVLAATVRALCVSCVKTGPRSSLLGCPLLLQLWSFERFPIGRPWVDPHKPYEAEFYHGSELDGPTFGSMWTRRQVSLFIFLDCLYTSTSAVLTNSFRRYSHSGHGRTCGTATPLSWSSSTLCLRRVSFGRRTPQRRCSTVLDTEEFHPCVTGTIATG
jgi:hypothetical protein